MCKILILDNDGEIIDITTKWLYNSKIIQSKEEVISVTNIKNAKKAITECIKCNTFPVLLFVDLILDNSKSGIDFIKWFRDHNYISTIFAIASSNVSFKDLTILTELGVDNIFKKPLNFNNIILNIYSILNALKIKEKIFANNNFKSIQHKYIKNLDKFLGDMKRINTEFQELNNNQEHKHGIN